MHEAPAIEGLMHAVVYKHNTPAAKHIQPAKGRIVALTGRGFFSPSTRGLGVPLPLQHGLMASLQTRCLPTLRP
jgi:hypothetical protein